VFRDERLSVKGCCRSNCFGMSLGRYPANADLSYRKAHVTIAVSAARLVGCFVLIFVSGQF